MSNAADIDKAAHLVAELNAVLDGKNYRVALAALGVLLTEFIAAHEPKDRDRALRLLMDGVRRDVDQAASSSACRMVITGEDIVWH